MKISKSNIFQTKCEPTITLGLTEKTLKLLKNDLFTRKIKEIVEEIDMDYHICLFSREQLAEQAACSSSCCGCYYVRRGYLPDSKGVMTTRLRYCQVCGIPRKIEILQNPDFWIGDIYAKYCAECGFEFIN